MKKALSDAGHPAGETGLHLRDRLLQPLPLLHEHLRHPLDPRPGPGGGHRAEGQRGPTSRCGSSPATATPCHRRQPPDPLIRRNLDINIVLFNNRIYGLTKGQYSPTSPLGKVTKSTPMGAIDNPLHILSVAIGCEATFVARTVDINTKHLGMVLKRAAEHRAPRSSRSTRTASSSTTGPSTTPRTGRPRPTPRSSWSTASR